MPSSAITRNQASITGPKIPPMKPAPFLLHHEQPDQDDDGQRHHGRRQRRRVDLEAFDRAQHRDRRRDGAVAVEQGGADQSDDQKLGAPGSRLGVAGRQQRQQRHDAAFAAVVGAQDQQRVFERNDQDQRPQDQRHHAEDRLRRERPAMGGGLGRFLQRIERAGADVAIDDAERADRGRQGKGVDWTEAAAGVAVTGGPPSHRARRLSGRSRRCSVRRRAANCYVCDRHCREIQDHRGIPRPR